MAALHPTTLYNVEASVNQWFEDRAASISLPLSLSYQRLYIWPEKPVSDYVPCITLTHASIGRQHEFLGNLTDANEQGGSASNLVDISVWVSRRNNGVTNPSWSAHLRVLRSVVEEIFHGPVGIVVKDYRSTPASPSNTIYRVTTGGLDGGAIIPDPNPDMYHYSYKLRYNWTQRTNITA